jgi:hypothetical protein
MIIILVGISLLRVDQRARTLNPLQRGVVGAALIVAQSVALHTNLRRYITGNDQYGFNLNVDKEWWWNTPIPPMMVWAVGSLAFAIAVVLVLAMTDEEPMVHTTGGDCPQPVGDSSQLKV